MGFSHLAVFLFYNFHFELRYYHYSGIPYFETLHNSFGFDSVDPSSFIYVKILKLTFVWRLVSVFPYYFCGSSPCCCADDKCLPKGNNSKIKSAKAEKTSENHWTRFLILAIKEKYPLFPFKMYLTGKKMLRRPFWELNYGQLLYVFTVKFWQFWFFFLQF